MKAGRAERISLGEAEHLDARSFKPNDDDLYMCVMYIAHNTYARMLFVVVRVRSSRAENFHELFSWMGLQ